MKLQTYDLVFGLGQACSCTETLRKAQLQLLSFPYDWVTTIHDPKPDEESDVLSRVHQLCDGFSTWFDRGDFELLSHQPTAKKDPYVCRRLNLIFNHDFPSDLPYEQAYELVRARYRRRAARLLQLIRSANRVLLVLVDRPNQTIPTRIEDCRRAREILSRAFAPAKFDFFLFRREEGRDFGDRLVEEIEPGFTCCRFDYRDTSRGAPPYQVRIDLTSRILAQRFEVRDYRTKEEKKAYAETRFRKRSRRTRERIAKLRQWLSDVFLHGRLNLLEDIRAHKRQQKYDQFVILGFNCETAFRFYCRWGFLDSSLFAWANTIDLATLAAALGHLADVGGGTFTFHEASRMWRCDNSRIYFHGRLKAGCGAAPSAELLTADREELRSRLSHLKEKFRTYATNDKSTLFVYRLGEDARRPDLGQRLDALERALTDLGARNWKLLVVCERRDLDRMPPGHNRVFRAVTLFNPPANVTTKRKGDSVGWNRIFTEFAPALVRQKAHDFKFETH